MALIWRGSLPPDPTGSSVTQHSAHDKLQRRDSTIPALCLCCHSHALLSFDLTCLVPSIAAGTSGRADRNPVVVRPRTTFCPSPLKKKLLQTDLPRKSLGFCARALESHWYRAGLSLLTLRKLFYPVVPCATSFERGALKIKGEVARAVSSHCLSSRRSFMLCGICLFILFLSPKDLI